MDRPRPLPPGCRPVASCGRDVRPRSIGFVEAIEDVWQVLFRYARTGVAYCNANEVLPVLGGQFDPPTARRVADGVGGNVLENLLQPVGVASHVKIIGGHGRDQVQPAIVDIAGRVDPARDERAR